MTEPSKSSSGQEYTEKFEMCSDLLQALDLNFFIPTQNPELTSVIEEYDPSCLTPLTGTSILSLSSELGSCTSQRSAVNPCSNHQLPSSFITCKGPEIFSDSGERPYTFCNKCKILNLCFIFFQSQIFLKFFNLQAYRLYRITIHKSANNYRHIVTYRVK